MEGYGWNQSELEGWAARAAKSYQELARAFSAYVKQRENVRERDREHQGNAVMEQLCRDCMQKTE